MEQNNILELVKSIVLRIDRNGNVLYINKYGQDFFGFTSAQLVGKNVVGTILLESNADIIEKVLANPDKYANNENRNVTSSGNVVWVSWSNKAICDTTGEVLEMVCAGNDVTELYQTREELKELTATLEKTVCDRTRELIESENRFRSIIEHAPDAILVLDADSGKTIGYNQRAIDLFERYPLESFKIEDLYSDNQPDGMPVAESISNNIKRVIGGEELTLERIIRKPDGTEITCEVRLCKLPSNNLNLIRNSYIDITERKNSELRVKQSELLFRSLFKDHSAIMLLLDPESGKIKNANKAAIKFYGYPDLLSMSIGDINPMPIEEQLHARNQAMLREKDRFIFPHKLSNGDVRTVDVCMAPVQVGEYVVLCSIIFDITDKIAAERALRESEELFKSMFEKHDAAMTLIDPETGEVIRANQAAIDYYGYKNLVGMRTRDFNLIPAEEGNNIRGDIMTGQQRKHVIKQKKADGSIKTSEIYSTPVVLNSHTLIFSISHDITDRVTSEMMLKDREAQLRKAFSALQEIVAITQRTIAFEEESKTLRDTARDAEIQKIEDALRIAHGKQNKAAAVLGISRVTLSRRLERLNINPKDFR